MESRRPQVFNLTISIAIGLVAALVAWRFIPEAAILLGVLPMCLAVFAYAYLEYVRRREGDSVDTELATPNQCQPALSAAGVGAWIWDAESGAFNCTEDVYKILGYENLQGSLSIEAFKSRVFKEDRDAFEKAVEGVVSGQRKSPFDCRFVREDRGLVWVEVTMCLVDGQIPGTKIAGVLSDVTERKSEERALDRGSAYLEAILESTDDIVFSMDRQYRLAIFNQRFIVEMRAAYGVALHVGDNLIEILADDLVAAWRPRFDRVLDGESIRLQDAFVVKGRWFYFDVSLKPIREKGYVNGVAVYGRNITRQRQRVRELRKAKEQAVESDRLKSAFLANMSHEIRTPLNAVMGFAQLLKSDSLSKEESSRFIDVILSNGNHLLHILGDIIDLAQIESGQLRIEPEACDLSLLLGETCSVFRDRIRSEAGGLIELFADNDLSEEDRIFCDKTRLKQVVYNLVSNAIKFTLKGHIRLGYERKEGAMIEFYVADTGSGILPEMKKRIFQRFRQGSELSGRKNDGVGLGLSICEGLVKLLGGEIWVEDNTPHGSVFKFTIKDHFEGMSVSRNSQSSGRESEEPARKEEVTFKILVAEDDDTNYLVIEEFLRFEKIKSVRAVNGLEAIKMLQEHDDIGLVVMDISMPVMDGLKATQEIKRIRPEIPIIAHTAHAMQSELDQALQAGCADCLVKPISIENFRAILDRYAG